MADNALVLRFGADVEPAKRGLTSLAQAVGQHMGTISLVAQKMTGELGKTSTAFAALNTAMQVGAFAQADWVSRGTSVLGFLARHRTAILGLLAAYAAFKLVAETAIDGTRERLEKYLDVADKAREADLGATLVQALPKIAGDLPKFADDVKTIEKALDGIKEKFRNTFGSLSPVDKSIVEIFRDSGLTPSGARGDAGLETLNDQTATTEAKVRAVIDLIDDLIAQGHRLEGLKLAEALFGEDASRILIDRMQETGRALRDLVDEAGRGKGLVDPEAARRAEELRDRLDAAHQVVADSLKPVLDDIASIVLSIKEGWVVVNEAIATVVQTAAGLYGQVKAIMDLLPAIGMAMTGNLSGAAGYVLNRNAIQGSGVLPVTIQRYNRQIVRDESDFEQSRNPGLPGAAPLPPGRPAAGGGGRGGGRGSGSESLTETERQIQQLEKSIRTAKAELETIGQSNAVKERAEALAKASADASEEERQKIAALGEEYGKLKDQIEAANEQHQRIVSALNEFGSELSGAFKDAILEGKSLNDVLQNLLKSLAGKGIDQLFGLLFGGSGTKDGGILGALVGGLFGGVGKVGAPLSITPRAGGGPVEPGQVYRVGEFGPETVTFDRPGYVHPAGSGLGMPVTVNNYAGMQIDTRTGPTGLTIDVVDARIAGMLRANNRQMSNILADQQRRM